MLVNLVPILHELMFHKSQPNHADLVSIFLSMPVDNAIQIWYRLTQVISNYKCLCRCPCLQVTAGIPSTIWTSNRVICCHAQLDEQGCNSQAHLCSQHGHPGNEVGMRRRDVDKKD